MSRNIAIVIPTYNRPIALKRLLHSIASSDFLGQRNIDIIISCDYIGNDYCKVVAEDFKWEFGNKKIIVHEQNLGLREHVFYCGDLVKDYDGIIMLEDDLFVAPNFYKYVVAADSFFKNENKVAQISLYNYRYDDYSSSIFSPLGQDADNFFMQVPSSWGQYWTQEQWLKFRTAYKNNELSISENSVLPKSVIKTWPESSWKKYLYNYIVLNNLFVVYPYVALSTNFGEEGTHYSQKIKYTQTVLDLNKQEYKFTSFESSKVVYDYNFELHKNVSQLYLNKDFVQYSDLEFDINGTKDLTQVKSEYLISSKACSKPIHQFSDELMPQELNVFLHIEGYAYTLAKTIDFKNEIPKNKIAKRNIEFLPQSLISKIENRVKREYEAYFVMRLQRKVHRLLGR